MRPEREGLDTVFELRFYDGDVQAVDEHHGLTPEQLTALNQGRARLVVRDEDREEVVLTELQPSGDVMILPNRKACAGGPSSGIQR